MLRDPQIISSEDEAIMRFEEETIPQVAAQFDVAETVVDGVVFWHEDWHSLSEQIDAEYESRKQHWDDERENAKLERALSLCEAVSDEYGRLEPMA